MSAPAHRLHPIIRAELDATGLPWTIENGKRHLKVIVGGQFCGILSHGRPLDDRGAIRNTVSQIRRAARHSLTRGK